MIRILKLSELGEAKSDIMLRGEKDVARVEESARAIIEDVRKRGDEAVLEYVAKFDGVVLTKDEMRVKEEEIEAAYSSIDPELMEAIKRAYNNIKKFHEHQMPANFRMETEAGVEVGTRILPVARAGLYVPGGKAVYPSVMLMLAVPAKAARVGDVIVCMPPQKDGKLDVASLVVAGLCGVTVYKVGGIQAIAAMAYGTETIPRCDVIAGPGGPYVSAAERLVRNDVRIDFPPGPSEGMVLADGSANPRFVAADILSEAEHGPDSAGVLVTDSQELANKAGEEFDKMVEELPEPRKGFVLRNLARYSAIIVANNMDDAITFVNEYAPEHLAVNTMNPENTLSRLKTAGTYCLGPYSPITAGNFAAGPNAILPTGGFGRFISGVSVDTFLKKPTVEKISKEGLRGLRKTLVKLSEFEGFPAHKKSVEVRFENG
jgi:histidinol dehydrogenase